VVPQSPDYIQGATSASTVLARLLDTGHQRIIWDNMTTMAVKWGGPLAAGSLPLTVALGVAAACRREGRVARGFLSVAVVMVAGYLTVYMLTPLDIAWLVQTTFDRLILQIWPLMVVAACAPSTAGETAVR
jgi:acyl dehydratase